MGNVHETGAHRAGRYVRQPSGYRAFIPNPLPPDPPVVVSPEMPGSAFESGSRSRATRRIDSDTPTPRPVRVHVRPQGSRTFEPN